MPVIENGIPPLSPPLPPPPPNGNEATWLIAPPIPPARCATILQLSAPPVATFASPVTVPTPCITTFKSCACVPPGSTRTFVLRLCITVSIAFVSAAKARERSKRAQFRRNAESCDGAVRQINRAGNHELIDRPRDCQIGVERACLQRGAGRKHHAYCGQHSLEIRHRHCLTVHFHRYRCCFAGDVEEPVSRASAFPTWISPCFSTPVCGFS